MKATIEFDLNGDQYEYSMFNKSIDLANILWELTHNTRKKCERELADMWEEGLEKDAYVGMDLVFDKINELLTEYNIDPETLG